MDRETKTKRFLSRALRDHYRSVDLHPPYRFTSREFAFIYWGQDGMHRPVSFDSRKDAVDFLQRQNPLHAYYSTAYYSNPGAPMKDKEWLGADLVFDLDADHLPGAQGLTYPEQLEEVKKRTRLLLDDFLMGDFGFQEDELSLFFSGHRGYHIHVRRERALQMSAQARREIVDYITGVGLDLDVILPSKEVKTGSFKDIDKKASSPRLPDEEKGGWSRRTRRLISELLKRLESLPEENVIREITEKHRIGSSTAEALYQELFGRAKWKIVLDQGELDVFSEEGRANVKTFRKIIDGILEEGNVQAIGSDIIGATDEPVTGDTKRLIRLPTSIHGGSFLRVVPIHLDSFPDFHPLRDATMDCLEEQTKRIAFDHVPDMDFIELGGREFTIQKEMEVPEYAAAFLISKFKAKLI